MKLNRRRFINVLLGGGAFAWLASIVYPVVRFLLPPEVQEVEPDMLSVGPQTNFVEGSSKIIKFGKKPVIVIRAKGGDFLAFAATCTHLDCIVQYRDDMGAIWCACHNGKYDLSGRNISGPPPRPLQQFNVKVIKDEVFVVKTA